MYSKEIRKIRILFIAFTFPYRGNYMSTNSESRNNVVLSMLANYGCNNPELYRNHVLVTAFGVLQICLFELFKRVQKWNASEERACRDVLTNPKQAGRPRFDVNVILACCIVRIGMGLSDLQLIQRVSNDIFVRAIVSAFVGKQLNISDIPSLSTFQKYQFQWSRDRLITEAFDDLTRSLCEYAKITKVHQSRLNAIDQLPISQEQQEEIKNFGACSIVDSAFICTDINHLNKDYYNAIKEGKESEYAGTLTFNSESHKRMHADFGYKYGRYYHGLKLHIAVEALTGLIVSHKVTKASANDLKNLIDIESDFKKICPNAFFCIGDSGYRGQKVADKLAKNYGIEVLANNKPNRYTKLSPSQLEENSKIGKLRCFVEHPFSFIKRNLNLRLSCIDDDRMQMDCQLGILIYNAYKVTICASY